MKLEHYSDCKRTGEPKIGIIVPAAGIGTRMGAGVNKQYIELNEIPILARTLLAIKEVPQIDRICVVVAQDEQEIFQESIADPFGITEVTLVEGGNSRQESVQNGLSAFDDFEDKDIILVHDGARPFISREIIENVIEGVKEKGASLAAIPVTDTVKLAKDGEVVRTIPRKQLYSAQTPQGAYAGLLREAYFRAAEENFSGTDDVSLIERLNYPVSIAKGSFTNIKLTGPTDLILARALLDNRERTENHGRTFND